MDLFFVLQVESSNEVRSALDNQLERLTREKVRVVEIPFLIYLVILPGLFIHFVTFFYYF